MEESKVYVLQKDSPECKAGAEFCSNSIGDYICSSENSISGYLVYFSKSTVENNPEWFLPKEKVKPVVINWGECAMYGKYDYLFFMLEDKNKKVDSLKEYRITKRRLAEILIAESKSELKIKGND